MRLSRPFRVAAIVLAIGALLPGAALAVSQSVVIQNFSFLPQNATINVGESITWLNTDAFAHTATSDTGAFNTGSIAPGGNKTVSFGLAGTFAYHCAIHPSMMGRITVLGAATQTPAPTPVPSTPRPTPPPTTAPPTTVPPASPSPSSSPSPTAGASSTAAPLPTTTVAPTQIVVPTATGGPSGSPAPGPDLGTGPGPVLAIGGLVIAAGLAGVAVYLYRRR